jgi:IS30 family transposase
MPWTDDERQRCYELADFGASSDYIANELGKPRAVVSRLLHVRDQEAREAKQYKEREAQEEAFTAMIQRFVSEEKAIERMRILMDCPRDLRYLILETLEEDMKLLQSLYNFTCSFMFPKPIVADEPPQPN